MPPTPGDVILAIFSVLLGAIAAASAIYFGFRSGNWLAYICGVGCVAFVAGIAGQQTFPSASAIARLGASAAQSSSPGPWDAGVSLPFVTIRMTPVAIVGLLVAAVGLSLLLLFERIPDPTPAARRPLRSLEEDDAI
jgi:hypothetical protein